MWTGIKIYRADCGRRPPSDSFDDQTYQAVDLDDETLIPAWVLYIQVWSLRSAMDQQSRDSLASVSWQPEQKRAFWCSLAASPQSAVPEPSCRFSTTGFRRPCALPNESSKLERKKLVTTPHFPLEDSFQKASCSFAPLSKSGACLES